MGGFYVHNPKHFTVVHGSILIGGYAEGSMITVSKRENTFEMVAGSQADVVMNRMTNPIGEIRVRLLPESPTNAKLSALHLAQAKGDFPLPVPTIVRDRGKLTKHKAGRSIIAKMPDDEMAAEVGAIEWIFICGDLESFIGGALPLPV